MNARSQYSGGAMSIIGHVIYYLPWQQSEFYLTSPLTLSSQLERLECCDKMYHFTVESGRPVDLMLQYV